MKTALILIAIVFLSIMAVDQACAQKVGVDNQNQMGQQQTLTGGTQTTELNATGTTVPRPYGGYGDIILPQILPWTSGDRSTSPGMVPPQNLLMFGAEFTYEQLEPYANTSGYNVYGPMQVPEKKGWTKKDKVRFIFSWPAERDQNGNIRLDPFGAPIFVNPPKPVGHLNCYATSTDYKQMMANLANGGMKAIRYGVNFLHVAAFGSERELTAKLLSAMIGGGGVTISPGQGSSFMGLGGFGAAMGAAKTPDKPWVQLIALKGEAPSLPTPIKAEVTPQTKPCEKCEKALKEEQEHLDEALEELRKEKSKPVTLGPRACPVTIHFPRGKDKFIPYAEEMGKFAEWVRWIETNEKELAEKGYKGGQYRIEGHCDIYELLGKDLINPKLGFWRARDGLAELKKRLPKDFDFKKIAVVSGGSDTPWHPEARLNIAADEPLHWLNRHTCIVWVPEEGAIHGHTHIHAESASTPTATK